MTAIYPGRFDPVTSGHMDIIIRAAQLFDHLIIAVLDDASRPFLFTAKERATLLTEAAAGYAHVRVECFSGLLADFADKQQASFIVRGARNGTDFEAETVMAQYNRLLSQGEARAGQLETLVLPASASLSHVSGSAVRETARLVYTHNYDDSALDTLVSPNVKKALKERLLWTDY